MGYCSTLLTAYPLTSYVYFAPNDIGIIPFIAGIVNILMSFLTIFWIKRQAKNAREEMTKETNAGNVIFPVFVKVLWVSAIVNVYFGIIYATVPAEYGSKEAQLFPAFFYASLWALQHSVIEGISLLLMQKGCGTHAENRAGRFTYAWTLLTFFVMIFVFYYNTSIMSVFIQIIWDFLLVIFYLLLWQAPSENLFRRPAAIEYAKFWMLYRLGAVIVNVLNIIPSTQDVSFCGYIMMRLLILSIFQPWVCYWTLLQDSKWWQGDEVEPIYTLFTTMLSPLLTLIGYGWLWGTYTIDEEIDRLNKKYVGSQVNRPASIKTFSLGVDFSLYSAQNLAQTMDDMRVQGQVRMLNFASIKIDFQQLLGSGSFSKVYTGFYRGEECAIKLIRTVDLTTDVIRRVAAEASILSSIRHPNIVNIIGVSVLPPSVCLILEKCSFGSLSDVIRGYGFDWSIISRPPLTLSMLDVLWLALGCAKGLAAVHSYGKFICHRDVKSFNFLVDKNFNVKIADLELGSFVNKTVAPNKERDSKPSLICTSLKKLFQFKSSIEQDNSTSVSNRYDDEIVLVQNQSEDEITTSQNLSIEGDNKSLVRLSTLGSTIDDSDFDDFLSNKKFEVDNPKESRKESVGGRFNTFNSVYNSQINKFASTKSNFNEPFKECLDVDGLIVNWLAPEVINTGNFIQASDVYSLGTVFWEILSRKAPYENIDQMSIREMVTSGYNLPLPVETENSQLAKIIKLCWSFNPKERPTAEEVVARLEIIVQDFPFLYCDSKFNTDVNEIPPIKPLLDYYEKLYKKIEETKSWISPLFSNSLFSYGNNNIQRENSLSINSCVSVDLSIPDDNSVGNLNEHQSFLSKFKSIFNSDINQIEDLRASTSPSKPAETQTSQSLKLDNENTDQTLDIENSQNLSDRIESIDSYRSSYSVLPNPSKVLSSQLQIQDIAAPILAIQKQLYWQSLEKNNEAWFVVTVEAPHIILHATSHFYSLLGIPLLNRPSIGDASFGNNLMSLQNLLFNNFDDIDYSNCHFSNTYVENASMKEKTHPSSFKNMCSYSSSRVKEFFFKYEQFHDIINFHLPSTKKRYGVDSGFESERSSFIESECESNISLAHSSNSRQISTTSSSNKSALQLEKIGSNKMCTIHGFPVYSNISSIRINKDSHNSLPKVLVEENEPIPSSNFFSSLTKSFSQKKVDSRRPMYYIMMMKELKSTTSANKMIVKEKFNSFRDSLNRLSDSISGSSNSRSASLYNFFSRPSASKQDDPNLIQLNSLGSSNNV